MTGAKRRQNFMPTGGVFCCRYDSELTLISAKSSLFRFLGYPRKEFSLLFDNKLARIVHPDDLPLLLGSVSQQLNDSNMLVNEARLVCKDQTVKWIWVSAELLHSETQGDYFRCMFHDISERVLAQQQLALSEQRYELIMQQTQDTIFEWNCETNEIYYSPNFEKKFGYRMAEKDFPQGLYESGVIHPEDLELVRAYIGRIKDAADGAPCEHRLRRADGSFLWVRIHATALRDANGNPQKVLGILSDINEQKQRLLHAAKQATHDPLTELYNCGATESQISLYLAQSREPAALLVLDVDHFKGVNDTLGHIYGDAVLSDMAFHLKNLFRKNDILGRVGGDEFVVFLGNITQKDPVFEKIGRIMTVFRRSLMKRGVQYEISSSIGIAFFPEHGTSYRELFEKADIAMYHAKNSGKDQYAVYDPALAPNGSLPRLCPAEAPAATVAPKNFRKHAVEYIFRIFLENPDVDKAIPVLFDLVGKLFVLSRIELFEVSDDRQQLCATFDWSAAEAPPRNSAQSAAVCAELLRDIGDWDGKELYGTRTEGPGILARLLCPIRESEQPIAAINFEMYSDSGMPAIAERETLSLLSEAVGLFLTRARKRELLKKQQEFFGSLLKQVNAYIYCINPATYEVIFANEQLASKVDVRPGNTCYRSIRGYDAPCPDCPLQELHTVDDRVTKELYHPSLKRWSETTASLIRWDNDQLIGLFSSYDITQYRADAARIAFANENLPGGMLGGYLEKGLPLYFINDCMLRYLGYPDKEAFIAATDGLLVNCIYDEDRPAVLDAIRRGLSENGEYEFTHRIKKQDGGYLWVNEIGKRIVAEDGKPSIICLCMDVSPQMELRNQLNLYRSAARGGAFVVRIDEDFTLLYGNDIFYDVYGYPKPSKAEEPDRVQTKCVNYIHPDDLPYVRQLVHDSVAAGKTTLQWEMRIVTGSDRLRWLLTTGTLEYRGKELVMNGFITEITELHELREKLARDEQRYRIALRQINTNVWEYDLRTRAVSMTESAEEKHGHLGHLENVPESLIQSGYIHPSSHADFRALYQKLYDGEKCAQADILTQTADKTGWWWERITYTTIFDVAGAPIRAVAVGEDITHQKEAEIKYQQELQMRYTLLQGLIASSKVNLSTNTVELLQGDSQPASVPPNRMTYTDLFELGLQHISNPNDRERYSAIFTRAALQTAFEQHQEVVSMEYRRINDGGRLIWASAAMRLMKETVTGDLYAYGTVRSINEQKTIELALQQRAEKDPLTNAYSQDTALKIMTDALLLEKNGQSGYALLAFDIDNFSQLINQSGYMTAESVLTELSDLLRLKFGSTQIMGRFYDDELVLLLGDHPLPNPVRETAEGICRSMAQPYMFSAAKIPVRVSVGIAFGLANEGLQVLYGRARIALGVAKSSEKTHCVLYQDTTHDADLPRTEAPLGPASLSLLGDAQSVLLRCVFLLTEAADLPSAVVPTLTELAAFYAADRAYLLLPKERFAAPCDFYEWKKENVLSKRELPTLLFQPDTLLKSDEAPLLKQRLMLDDISIIRSVWPQAHERLLRQGLHSFYFVPLEAENRVIGYLGIDNPQKNQGNLLLLDAVCPLLLHETLNRQVQERQAYLSTHDPLTGLLNRNSFMQYKAALREETLISLGIAVININGLRTINTRYSREFGDNVLCSTADAMCSCFCADRIHRFSGDEFLAVCENLTQSAFLDRVEQFRGKLQKLYPSCASIGAVWADSGIHLDTLLNHADEHMMVEKQAYYKHSGSRAKGHDPAILRTLLRELESHHYLMYLQPKADIATGRIVGAEALVRYMDPVVGLLGPNKFVPSLEKEGLIRYIDLFVFEEVCKTLASWISQKRPVIPISLNFSRSTLLEEHLIQTMEQIRTPYGVDKSLIEIEITESFGDMERNTVARIGRLIRESGYRLSLDDFGAQYSNIAILSVMDLDVLKLDKALVDDLISNANSQIIVRNFLTTCKELCIKSVAEGVETLEQLQVLQELGCDVAQGYYFNKPIPLADFERTYLEAGVVFS